MVVRGLDYLGGAIDISYNCGDVEHFPFPTEVVVNLTKAANMDIYLSSDAIDAAVDPVLLSLDNPEKFKLSAAAASTAGLPVSFKLSPDLV